MHVLVQNVGRKWDEVVYGGSGHRTNAGAPKLAFAAGFSLEPCQHPFPENAIFTPFYGYGAAIEQEDVAGQALTGAADPFGQIFRGFATGQIVGFGVHSGRDVKRILPVVPKAKVHFKRLLRSFQAR